MAANAKFKKSLISSSYGGGVPTGNGGGELKKHFHQGYQYPPPYYYTPPPAPVYTVSYNTSHPPVNSYTTSYYAPPPPQYVPTDYDSYRQQPSRSLSPDCGVRSRFELRFLLLISLHLFLSPQQEIPSHHT